MSGLCSPRQRWLLWAATCSLLGACAAAGSSPAPARPAASPPASVEPPPPPPPPEPAPQGVSLPGSASAFLAVEAAPLLRKGGNLLLVQSPPRLPRANPYPGPRRLHTEGGLNFGQSREWVGPPVPLFIPLEVDGLELHLLDPQPGGEHLAVYYEPLESKTCSVAKATSCGRVATLFDREGKPLWSLDLKALMPKTPSHLILDLRLDNGVLYANPGCDSPIAFPHCNIVIAADPQTGKVLWRSSPQTSSRTFALTERFLVTVQNNDISGQSVVRLLRRSDGKTEHTMPMPSVVYAVALHRSGLIEVTHGYRQVSYFKIEAGSNGKATLAPTALPAASAAASATPPRPARSGFPF